ncbi:MAG TPA: hypothetical protein VJU82_15830 [Acidobacteriaceae bacterium]|nr:hypothetical protein [Acidobacteriaceae bacterium]
MNELFLSASVPVVGRGSYYQTADPFLIQYAVRELITAIIGRYVLVWGGHPAITPMIWAVCEDLDVKYAKAVILYQSSYFAEQYPEENARFGNAVYVPAVEQDRAASLRKMRREMLSRPRLSAGVFIGGMEGVEEEYGLFAQLHPTAPVIALGAPGGAARELARHIVPGQDRLSAWSANFARVFREELPSTAG